MKRAGETIDAEVNPWAVAEIERVKREWQELQDRHPAGRLQVTISNALNAAAQRLSLPEKRAMMYAVSKLDTFKKDGGTHEAKVKLIAHEYAGLYEVDPRTAYEQLQFVAESLMHRQISWWEQSSGRSGKKVQINWLSKAEYHKGEGCVTLWFTPHMAPHLLKLTKQFTTYKLAQASSLKSVYSWRLLELLSQYKTTGWREIQLDEFHHSMETSATAQANFKECRIRVIEPAVEELTEKDGWLIQWQPIKTGRKVTALRFEFMRDPQGNLFREAQQ